MYIRPVNIVTEYIKYHWNAKERHGIHSPFVYDLSDKCLTLQFPKELRQQRNNLLKKLRHSKEIIQVTDLGAGSMKMDQKRPVQKILKYSSSQGKWSTLLYKLCAFYQPQNILELGSSLGIGTWHLNKGNPTANLTSIEGCPETWRILNTYIGKSLNDQVKLINSSFDEYLEKLTTQSFDFIFIDGHHDGDALKMYVEQLLPFSHHETLFLLDDIRWSQSMFNAWNTLKSDPQFHVSIDLFRMGILVKRPFQEKEHFTLKF